jgi:hypothetical protein
MKKLLPFLLLAAMSCKKEDPQPPTTTAPQNYVIVNGDGHSNERHNLTEYLQGWRIDSTGHTALGGNTADLNSGIALYLNAAANGSASIINENQGLGQSALIVSSVVYKYATGTATITKYEPVGGLIECNYNGTFKKVSDTTIAVTVSGVFSVTRSADQ